MRIRTIALVFGGACIVALGSIGVVACSSDSGSGTPTATPDATAATDTGAKADTGTVNTQDTGTVEDAGTGPGDDSSTPGDSGATADCGAPGSLHPVEAGTGPYCPFSAVGDAGNLTCPFGQHCLENAGSNAGPSVCAATGPAPDGGTDWECQGPANCATGSVCCAITTGAGQDPGCPNHFLHKFTGTTCRAGSCQAGEIMACEAPADCAGAAGTSCQVTKAKGGTFGLCL